MAIQGVQFNVADSKEIRRFLEGLDPRTQASVSAVVLEKIANATAADAKLNRIVRGRPLTAKALPNKLTWRSGDLTNSIAVDPSGGPTRQIVGSRMEYAAVHEQGIRPFKRRPYFEPAAVFVVKTKAPKYFRRALERLRAGQKP